MPCLEKLFLRLSLSSLCLPSMSLGSVMNIGLFLSFVTELLLLVIKFTGAFSRSVDLTWVGETTEDLAGDLSPFP